MALLHYNIRVTGRVQGVGFRFTARNMARVCGLNGFVKNDPDGSVYIEAEGEQANIDSFIKWCRKGPDMSYVTNVFFEQADLKNFKSPFTVRF